MSPTARIVTLAALIGIFGIVVSITGTGLWVGAFFGIPVLLSIALLFLLLWTLLARRRR